MGRKFKFAKTELQYSGQNAKPKYMVIEFLPEQVGSLTYTGEELFPTWKNLDPLKVSIEGELSATNAGKHYITVTPTGIFAWPDMTQTPKQIEYIIDRAVIDKVPTQKGSLTFNNTEQTPEWNDFDASVMTVGGVYQNQTHKGKYIATFTPDNNHCWQDKTFDAREVEWEIKVLELTRPALSQSSYPYTGNAIQPTVTNFNANFMSKAGDTTATETGNYSITIALLYAEDTCWAGGGTADITLSWAITVIKLPKVTANKTSFTYNGEMQEPTWINYNAEYITKIGSGWKNHGTYTTTFKLKTGCQWTDGTTADITISWTINTLQIPRVTMSSSSKTYNGEMQEPTWTNYNETYITKTGSAQTAVGNYTTTFSIKDKMNVSWTGGDNTDITHSWSIVKLKLAKVTASNLNLTWSGNAQEPAWQNYNATYINKNGDGAQTGVKWENWFSSDPTIGSYNTWFELKDTVNTCWSDNTTGHLNFDWKINPQTVKNPTFKSASISDEDGVKVDASKFNNVETAKGVELEEEKTYYEAQSVTVRFINYSQNYAFYNNSTYKVYYDVTITITDLRFPFTWTDTDGRTQTANNQTEFESKFPVVNTTTNSLTTKFTADGILLAEKFGQSNLSSGEVTLQSSSGSTKTYSCVSTATNSRPATMGIHIRKSNGAHIRGNVHIYR